jgi:hypothetical protein
MFRLPKAALYVQAVTQLRPSLRSGVQVHTLDAPRPRHQATLGLLPICFFCFHVLLNKIAAVDVKNLRGSRSFFFSFIDTIDDATEVAAHMLGCSHSQA